MGMFGNVIKMNPLSEEKMSICINRNQLIASESQRPNFFFFLKALLT